jgi:hypothetical protein
MSELTGKLNALARQHLTGNSSAELESLRQQLLDSKACCSHEAEVAESYREQLAESQAREKVLRDTMAKIPKLMCECGKIFAEDQELDVLLVHHSDSATLDAAIRQAKREVLLEAADYLFNDAYAECQDTLRRMADELKDA